MAAVDAKIVTVCDVDVTVKCIVGTLPGSVDELPALDASAGPEETQQREQIKGLIEQRGALEEMKMQNQIMVGKYHDLLAKQSLCPALQKYTQAGGA